MRCTSAYSRLRVSRYSKRSKRTKTFRILIPCLALTCFCKSCNSVFNLPSCPPVDLMEGGVTTLETNNRVLEEDRLSSMSFGVALNNSLCTIQSMSGRNRDFAKKKIPSSESLFFLCKYWTIQINHRVAKMDALCACIRICNLAHFYILRSHISKSDPDRALV